MKFSKIIALAGVFAGFSTAMFFSVMGTANAVVVTSSTTNTTTIALAVVASASTTVKPAVAATTTIVVSVVPSDNCGLTVADVAKITAVQNDPTLNSSQEVVQELAVRKQLIKRIVLCAQSDLQSLQSALAAAPAANDAAKSIQVQLAGRLNDVANFYSFELGKLDGAGIAGTKAIAGDVFAWRAGTYAPLVGQVNNFMLWSKNQNLFSTAQGRMDQTQRAVSFLENASADGDLQNAFNAARASFESAKNDNAAAQIALSQGLPPAQSLALIKQSLGELSDTYQRFFDVSDLIKKALPQ